MKQKITVTLLISLLFCALFSSCQFIQADSGASSDIIQVESQESGNVISVTSDMSSDDSQSVTSQQFNQPQNSQNESGSDKKQETSSSKDNFSKNNTSSKKSPTVQTNSQTLSSQSKSEVQKDDSVVIAPVPESPVMNAALDPIDPEEYYGWKQLQKNGTEAERRAYVLFVEKIGSYEKQIKFNFNITGQELENAYNHYRDDYPQHFWRGTATYRSYDGKYIDSFTLTNIMFDGDTQKIKKLDSQMKDKAKAILSKVNGSMSPIERERVIHDFLVNNTKYDTSFKAENAHNLYGALVNGVAVCEGYANAFQYLMREAGVQCILVKGDFNGDSHEWNMVELEGQFYHVDVTSDDPILNGGKDQILKFDYFNLTEAAIKTDHFIRDNIYIIPKATSNKYEFFQYYGLKTNSLNIEFFAKAMAFAAKNGYEYAHMRFEKVSVSAAADYLFDNYAAVINQANKLLDSKKLSVSGSISYADNEKKNILSLKLNFQ